MRPVPALPLFAHTESDSPGLSEAGYSKAEQPGRLGEASLPPDPIRRCRPTLV